MCACLLSKFERSQDSATGVQRQRGRLPATITGAGVVIGKGVAGSHTPQLRVKIFDNPINTSLISEIRLMYLIIKSCLAKSYSG
jgi:hypothetical protein